MQTRHLQQRTVSTQFQLDKLPEDFEGIVRIAGGNPERPLKLFTRFIVRPKAVGTANVVLGGEAWLRADDDCTVHASDHADIRAHGRARIFARGRSHVLAADTAFVRAEGRCTLRLGGDAKAHLFDYAAAKARGRSRVFTFTKAPVILEQRAIAWFYANKRPVAADPDVRIYDCRALFSPDGGNEEIFFASTGKEKDWKILQV